MLQHVKRLVPAPIRRAVQDHRDNRKFRSLPLHPCSVDSLASASDLDLPRIFRNPALDEEWREAEARIAELGITARAAGVNTGDRRALYYLVRHFDPRSVLEIGTHIGASTVHIAAALLAGSHSDFRLRTVDIWDVNDPAIGHWRKLGSTLSPAEMMGRLGCADRVEFYAEDSLVHLKNCHRHFDFIFLDGEHAARQVYQEVPLALELLNDGGHILLHDYFPDARPLWSNGRVVPGPFQAIQRFRSEGAPLEAVPLGALPWPTKLGSNVTSLALLGRSG